VGRFGLWDSNTITLRYIGYNYLQSKSMAMPNNSDTKRAKHGEIFGEEKTTSLSITSLKNCGSYSICICIFYFNFSLTLTILSPA
jgi:hypothetical protein